MNVVMIRGHMALMLRAMAQCCVTASTFADPLGAAPLLRTLRLSLLDRMVEYQLALEFARRFSDEAPASGDVHHRSACTHNAEDVVTVIVNCAPPRKASAAAGQCWCGRVSFLGRIKYNPSSSLLLAFSTFEVAKT